jgi:hypothetical protein
MVYLASPGYLDKAGMCPFDKLLSQKQPLWKGEAEPLRGFSLIFQKF